MGRIFEIKRVIKHKIMIFKLWKQYDTKVSLSRVIKHDLEKIILILFIGDKRSNKIHRRIARHHNIKTDNDFYEAYLDWASARHTKPNMQLDALEATKKFHPDLIEKSDEHHKNIGFK